MKVPFYIYNKKMDKKEGKPGNHLIEMSRP